MCRRNHCLPFLCVLHPIGSTDRPFQKGRQRVLEGSTLLPPNSFLTKALTVLFNPKPKKFTHWQLKYSSQKNIALQETLGPLTTGLGPQYAAAPQAWASSHGRPGQPCPGHPPLPDWKLSTFSFVYLGQKKFLSIPLSSPAFSCQISLSVTVCHGSASAALAG